MKKQIWEHIIDVPDYIPGMDLINEGESYENAYWKVPETPKLILGIDENTMQYAEKTIWNRDETKLKSISQEDSITVRKWLEVEYNRRKYGVHMLNGDKIIWLAPGYYFLLRWFKQRDINPKHKPNQLGDFRLIQNDILQLWEFVKKNKDILGLVLPKIKKSGITYVFAADALNELTLERNFTSLAMSKDYDTAKLTIMEFIKFGLDNLPWVFKPNLSKMNVGEFKFSKPKDFSKQTRTNRYLNNYFKLCKTKVAAFDGPVPLRAWIDEFPKVWKASKISLEELFNKSSEAVKIQDFINGKLLLTSYMPEEADNGYYDAIKICNNSLLSTIPEGGKRTRSGLILFPLYGHQSHPLCFNKYGECNEETAKKLIEAERKTKMNEKDIMAHKRQYPLNWSDMFENTGADSAFDNTRIIPILRELESRDHSGIRDYIEGNLRWENTLWEDKRPIGEFCNVYFEELTPKQIADGEKGSIKLYHDIEKINELNWLLNRSIRENIRRNGLLAPHPDTFGCASIDPVDYKLSSDVRQGSLNASYGGFIYNQNMDNIAGFPISNVPIYEYNYRHEDPDVILEDMIKICIYLGIYMIIEGNKGWLYTDFKKHGLQNFLLVKQSDGIITPWQDYKELHGGNKMISTDEQMISTYMRAISRYISKPRLGGIDYLKLFKSIPGLRQLSSFDPIDTRRFDLAVALGYWRVGLESLDIWIKKKVNQSTTLSENEQNELINNLKYILG